MHFCFHLFIDIFAIILHNICKVNLNVTACNTFFFIFLLLIFKQLFYINICKVNLNFTAWVRVRCCVHSSFDSELKN